MRKTLIGLLVLLVIIQFIRPARNRSTAMSANDISTVYPVPAQVQSILARACNDCHSNNTNYPWYTNIQPIGLWMQNHVDEGKDELNFSDFATYSPKKQAHKMEEVAEMVEEAEMPLTSYTLVHSGAKMSKQEGERLVTWAKGLQQQIEAQL